MAIEKVREGAVDPRQIRERYTGSFDMETAHKQWIEALDLRQEEVVTTKP
jgi:hypothetical protein